MKRCTIVMSSNEKLGEYLEERKEDEEYIQKVTTFRFFNREHPDVEYSCMSPRKNKEYFDAAIRLRERYGEDSHYLVGGWLQALEELDFEDDPTALIHVVNTVLKDNDKVDADFTIED